MELQYSAIIYFSSLDLRKVDISDGRRSVYSPTAYTYAHSPNRLLNRLVSNRFQSVNCYTSAGQTRNEHVIQLLTCGRIGLNYSQCSRTVIMMITLVNR